MGYDEIRVYGQLSDLSEDASQALADQHSLEIQRFSDGSIHLEYEGSYFFLDEFLDAVLEHADAETEGKVDYIDHHEWTLTRKRLEGGRWTGKTVSLNEVLDERYSRE